MEPLKPQQIWAEGVFNDPHGPLIAAYSPQTVGPQNCPRAKNGQKCPEAINFKNHHKKGQDPSLMVGPKGPKIHNLGNFQENGDKTPLEDFLKEFQSRQEGPKIKLAHSQ
ncbi:hypothetical protein O181_078149 [Austropuccinia psidii MF-1]|uniref:Uncharacterized protein n=1 Tax=Austropuccinia psidii MF-1 TaxID=1389203 RepID=A0A9Q3IH09_9BASI|nr:hypothetical protein [Austropuccinia psidii MF-1]